MKKAQYANFDWTHQNQVQTIDVNTPLGNTVGQLCQDGQSVLAVDGKGQVYQAASAEALSSCSVMLCRCSILMCGPMANGLKMPRIKYYLMGACSNSSGRLHAV